MTGAAFPARPIKRSMRTGSSNCSLGKKTIAKAHFFLSTSSEGLPSLMQESWPPPTSTAEAGEHLEESLDIPVYDGASSVDLPIGAGCSALVRHVLPNTPSTETVHMHLSFGDAGAKIHI